VGVIRFFKGPKSAGFGAEGAEGAGALEPTQPEDSPAMSLALTARAGDARAMARLLEIVGPRIHRVVRVVLGPSHPETEDVTQLALIGFTQAMAAFRGDCEPAHYASRIAVRTAVHARRRFRSLRARFDDISDVEAIDHTTPYDDAAAEHRKGLLRDLLAEIPAEQAEALALKVALGWSLEEIAAGSDVPVNTIRSRLRLAKEALRRKIEADPECLDELRVRS
jgi:RNA polymerase sigma-70 factor (ECF subfamily)